ncbi:ribonuclease iii [Culex quinquefasciatus]|uniref:Ribonuclease iii n=1 Tax=Culex quinquefasciatus TaxID=7176 RepID=B0X2S9_CULQU|nr:ribonuclease iii [Culex quinquefasciatus]|eukprot:XP_001863951.1 ribonuclease iii [Culex quinquefasciatus]
MFPDLEKGGLATYRAAAFQEDESLSKIWINYPLQEQQPLGDRHHIESFEMLRTLTKFEESVGVCFLFRIPALTLLWSSLVNNRNQAVICDDLGMTSYAVYSNKKADLKTKERADLLEAFLGALYVDKGLNTAKLIECNGPTNTRVYTMAVYFRLLACCNGHSMQQVEINAAKQALENSKDLFPQLDHQKRVIAQSLKRQKVRTGDRFDHERRDSLDSSTDPYQKRHRFLRWKDILSHRI